MANVLVYGSHGKEDAERAALTFIVGNTAVVSDNDTVVFLTAEGVRLATNGYADDVNEDGFPPVRDLIKQYLDGGGTLIACSACCQPRGITEDDLIDGAEIAGAARLVEYLANGYAPYAA